MRGVIFGVACATIVGCAGSSEPHVAVQPLVVVEHMAATEEPEPERADPLADRPVGGAERVGLEEPGRDVDSRWVSVEPSDYSTATFGVQPTLVFGPDAPEAERCMERGDCLRLVTYPEREPVDVEIVRVEPAHGDISRRLTLVPRGELADRWYAVEIQIERDVREAARVGELQLARFRPDSAPILTHALLNGRGELELRFSERLVGDAETSTWRLEDGRGPLACEGLGPGVDHAETRAVFVCDRPFEGRVRVAARTVLRTIVGTELRDEAWDPIDQFEIGEDATAQAMRTEAVVRTQLFSL